MIRKWIILQNRELKTSLQEHVKPVGVAFISSLCMLSTNGSLVRGLKKEVVNTMWCFLPDFVM